MSDSVPAVFLSYAREDTDAARRIAEALRAFGVEAWFDQNELRGGDTWDQKIRGQIRTCTLFLPVISANTQSRAEGYFRREWKLAVERTHDMAAGVAYIVPVVIDDTPESEAAVPDEFMRVQWTRLAHGVPTPQFVAQIKRLLESPRKASAATRPAFPIAAPAVAPGAIPAAAEPRSTRLPNGAVALVVIVLGVIAFIALRRVTPDPAETLKVAAEKKPAAAPQAPTLSEKSAPVGKSIAVLPFTNLSTEKENEFFADGLQDDVITSLAKIRDLTVISRTSTLAYRDPGTRNLKKIAAELNVATILEGSVARVGAKVHMNAQLIDARTDAHLWADTFDGDASDIFALQADLSQKIAAALKATLTPGERSLIERRPTENQAAYEIYQRARAISQEVGEGASLADYERILALYEQALAKDPSFALAYVQSALTHSIAYWFGRLDPSPARAEKTKAAVDAAVRLAPNAPETHLALGAYYYRVLRDWNRALAELRVAETALPNDAQLQFWLAVTHRRLGHWTECVGYFERAATLAPHDLAIVFNHAQTLRGLRQWTRALEVDTRALEFFPTDPELNLERARVQFALDGNRENFLRELVTLPADPSDPAGLGLVYRAAFLRGDFATADRVLVDPRLTVIPSIGSVIEDPPALHRAGVAWLRGDFEAARKFSEEAKVAYRARRWNDRQQPWVRMGLAQAEALAGQREVALRAAEAAFAEARARDALDSAHLRLQLIRILLVLDQRDAALAGLRESFAAYCNESPNEIRLDPFWARVKDDPRFEEILKSAKPL